MVDWYKLVNQETRKLDMSELGIWLGRAIDDQRAEGAGDRGSLAVAAPVFVQNCPFSGGWSGSPVPLGPSTQTSVCPDTSTSSTTFSAMPTQVNTETPLPADGLSQARKLELASVPP